MKDVIQENKYHIHMFYHIKEDNKIVEEEVLSTPQQREHSKKVHSESFLKIIAATVTSENFELHSQKINKSWSYNRDFLVTDKCIDKYKQFKLFNTMVS